MVFKPSSELLKELKSTNTKAVEVLLQEMDDWVIGRLKTIAEDHRYTQGYSAAVDAVRDLITKK